MYNAQKKSSVIALCSAALLGSAIAVAQDEPDAGANAISARQGFMQVVSWEAGPLFGMAKGEVAYDAGVASANAANLKAISQYDIGRLFVAGTSKADRPGKTRALDDIWADLGKFGQAAENWRAAVAVVAEEAGKGQAELTAAVGALGKACGECHKPFRADEF